MVGLLSHQVCNLVERVVVVEVVVMGVVATDLIFGLSNRMKIPPVCFFLALPLPVPCDNKNNACES
jgi:hypothetical protein